MKAPYFSGVMRLSQLMPTARRIAADRVARRAETICLAGMVAVLAVAAVVTHL